MLIKLTVFLLVSCYIIRLFYRATGRYQVIRAPKSSYREIGREWETCFVGAYGKCAMFLKEEQQSQQSLQFKYKIKRIKRNI